MLDYYLQNYFTKRLFAVFFIRKTKSEESKFISFTGYRYVPISCHIRKILYFKNKDRYIKVQRSGKELILQTVIYLQFFFHWKQTSFVLGNSRLDSSIAGFGLEKLYKTVLSEKLIHHILLSKDYLCLEIIALRH